MIYKLQLSNKESIQIDQEEYNKVKENISANFIELKRGIINPSFVVSIIPDYEATAQENKYKVDIDKLTAPISITKEQIKELKQNILSTGNL